VCQANAKTLHSGAPNNLPRTLPARRNHPETARAELRISRASLMLVRLTRMG
jgi:hypothetical protein